ncbi:MAG: nicotinamide-nucleotide amidohydrolase family protein [Streptosporangiales bacterium]|nr:nicotinamide-nucleotide amidohydrolase family protein [Streptosporangiales bacterium]
MWEPAAEPAPDPAELHRLLAARGATAAAAESLTGGLIAAALTETAGASATFRGAVVAYATDLKARLLGVDEELLAAYGAVHPEVAAAMAEGIRARAAATFGLAVTGVAGPDPQDGQPVGTVYGAVAWQGGTVTEHWSLTGDRSLIRHRTQRHALDLLHRVLVLAAREGEHNR